MNSEENVPATQEKLKLIAEKQAILDKQSALLDERSKILDKNSVAQPKDKCYGRALNKDSLVANYIDDFDYSSILTATTATLMPTLMVRIKVNGKCSSPIRALLDSGAQPNLILYSKLQPLQIATIPTARKVIGIDGNPIRLRRKVVLELMPWFESNASIKDEFWVLPKETDWTILTPSVDVQPIQQEVDLPMADNRYWQSASFGILLGVRIFAKLMAKVMTRSVNHITLIQTAFGTIVLGAQPLEEENEAQSVLSVMRCTEVASLDSLVKRLWEMDLVNTRRVRSKEEQDVEDNFVQTVDRTEDGRFIVTIPLKPDVTDIGSSRAIALKRFLFLERKLNKEPATKEKYVAFMREYEQLGHMRKVSEQAKTQGIVYHIPHHCVTKKFRVVFDASCRTDKGISLNEVQQLGEKLQRDLFEIVMRFRRHRVAFSADIKMMFRQVRIAENQWDLQRIFWRESRNDIVGT